MYEKLTGVGEFDCEYHMFQRTILNLAESERKTAKVRKHQTVYGILTRITAQVGSHTYQFKTNMPTSYGTSWHHS